MEMTKEFVPYEQALALKELGFNESCFGYYYTLNGKDWRFANKAEYSMLDDEINIGGKFTISAPLYQQAFRWFREKHNVASFIDVNDDTYRYNIILPNESILGLQGFNIYEEAELECLKKLIKIVTH